MNLNRSNTNQLFFLYGSNSCHGHESNIEKLHGGLELFGGLLTLLRRRKTCKEWKSSRSSPIPHPLTSSPRLLPSSWLSKIKMLWQTPRLRTMMLSWPKLLIIITMGACRHTCVHARAQVHTSGCKLIQYIYSIDDYPLCKSQGYETEGDLYGSSLSTRHASAWGTQIITEGEIVNKTYL